MNFSYWRRARQMKEQRNGVTIGIISSMVFIAVISFTLFKVWPGDKSVFLFPATSMMALAIACLAFVRVSAKRAGVFESELFELHTRICELEKTMGKMPPNLRTNDDHLAQ